MSANHPFDPSYPFMGETPQVSSDGEQTVHQHCINSELPYWLAVPQLVLCQDGGEGANAVHLL